MTRKILTVVGARPQFVKAAAVSRAFRAAPAFEEVIVHTGQHHDAAMSDIFFEELEIPAPRHNLAVAGGGHGQMTGRMLEKLEQVVQAENPAALLVYGDTNSTLAGALAAAKLHVPVIHVEAGLRSFNRRMPEEINRVMADHLSELLLCPTQAAVDNLAAEGLTRGVHLVGDVMYDATLFAIERSKSTSDAVERYGLTPGAYALCTLHRAENTDDPERLAAVLAFVAAEAERQPVLFPVHPRTRKMLGDRSLPAGLKLVDPVGYLDLHRLLSDAALVLTDSGGLQKEAYFHRKPCITLRGETEWVETVDAGWNRLWNSPEWISPRRDIPDYGDGRAAEAVVAAIAGHLGA